MLLACNLTYDTVVFEARIAIWWRLQYTLWLWLTSPAPNVCTYTRVGVLAYLLASRVASSAKHHTQCPFPSRRPSNHAWPGQDSQQKQRQQWRCTVAATAAEVTHLPQTKRGWRRPRARLVRSSSDVCCRFARRYPLPAGAAGAVGTYRPSVNLGGGVWCRRHPHPAPYTQFQLRSAYRPSSRPEQRSHSSRARLLPAVLFPRTVGKRQPTCRLRLAGPSLLGVWWDMH